MNDDDLHCGCASPYMAAKDVQVGDVLEENRRLREELQTLKSGVRKYMPTLGELLDRLTITQIKEVKIPEHKDKYAVEIKEIMHDIDLILSENKIVFDATMLRALIVIAQYNLHIWHNESNVRNGIAEGNELLKTHALNGIRNRAKNIIQGCLNGRMDFKVDCIAANYCEWEPSWQKI